MIAAPVCGVGHSRAPPHKIRFAQQVLEQAELLVHERGELSRVAVDDEVARALLELAVRVAVDGLLDGSFERCLHIGGETGGCVDATPATEDDLAADCLRRGRDVSDARVTHVVEHGEDANSVTLAECFAEARNCCVGLARCRRGNGGCAAVVGNGGEGRVGLCAEAEGRSFPDRASARVRDGDRAGAGLGHELFERGDVALRADRDNARGQHDLAEHVVVLGQDVCALRGVEHGDLDGAETDHIAVGGLRCDVLHRERAGCTGHVLGDHADTEDALELSRKRAR